MMAFKEFEPNWPAIAVVAAVIVNVAGWFILHLLAKRREAQKERRRQEQAVRKSLRLTKSQLEILLECVRADGFERGHAWVMRIDALGSWVRAGKHDFCDQSNPAHQAQYLDAFESLLNRNYFRREGGELYKLTGFGFTRAEAQLKQQIPTQPGLEDK